MSIRRSRMVATALSGVAIGALSLSLTAKLAHADDILSPSSSSLLPLYLLGLQTFAINETAQTGATASHAGLRALENYLRLVQDRLQGAQTLGLPILAYTDTRAQAIAPEAWLAADLRERPAPPPPPALQPLRYAVWGQGFGDYERRNGVIGGFDFGRRTTTVGGLGGIDFTKVGFLTANDATVFGVFAGYSTSYTHNNDRSIGRVEGGSLGYYGVYVNGGFALNSVSKIDLFDMTSTSATNFTRFHVNNVVSSVTASYKFNVGTWWLEPTAGVTGTWAYYDNIARNMGMSDGKQLRVQGGFRFGTSVNWNGVVVEPVFALQAYDDVSVRGGRIINVTAPIIPTYQGKVFAQGTAKLNFDLGRGLSAYLEGEARSSSSVFGAAGRGGIRYQF